MTIVVELEVLRDRLESRALPVHILGEPFDILFEEFWFFLSHSLEGVFCAFQSSSSIDWKFWISFREGQWEFNHVVWAYSCSLYNVLKECYLVVVVTWQFIFFIALDVWVIFV